MHCRAADPPGQAATAEGRPSFRALVDIAKDKYSNRRDMRLQQGIGGESSTCQNFKSCARSLQNRLLTDISMVHGQAGVFCIVNAVTQHHASVS